MNVKCVLKRGHTQMWYYLRVYYKLANIKNKMYVFCKSTIKKYAFLIFNYFAAYSVEIAEEHIHCSSLNYS